jgi:hypothetical protein
LSQTPRHRGEQEQISSKSNLISIVTNVNTKLYSTAYRTYKSGKFDFARDELLIQFFSSCLERHFSGKLPPAASLHEIEQLLAVNFCQSFLSMDKINQFMIAVRLSSKLDENDYAMFAQIRDFVN